MVDESRAALCIYHEDLDPEDLTRRLGLAPTKTFRRGHKAGPRSLASPHGAWLLEVRGEAPRGPDDVLRELLMQLAVEPTVWQDIVQTHKVRISPSLDLRAWNRGFAISPAPLKRIAQLGVELDFDIYANVEDDDA